MPTAAGRRLLATGYSPSTSNEQLRIAYCLLLTAYCRLLLSTPRQLQTNYCSLPTAYCLLLTDYCLLPLAAFYSPSTSNEPLLIANCQLLTAACCWLLATGCLILIPPHDQCYLLCPTDFLSLRLQKNIQANTRNENRSSERNKRA